MGTPPPCLWMPPADGVQLTAAEVQSLVNAAALSADGARLAVVVADRAGRVLAIFRRPDATDAMVEKALALARTGAFFSSQGTPLSSRTVRAISRVNFPEGIPNQPAGALFGIENTNRGCDFNVAYLTRPTVSAPAERRGHRATAPGWRPCPADCRSSATDVTVIGGIGVAGLDTDDQDENAAAQRRAVRRLLRQTSAARPWRRLYRWLPPAVHESRRRRALPRAPGGTFDIAPRNGAAAADGWLVGPWPAARSQRRRRPQDRAERHRPRQCHARRHPPAAGLAGPHGDLRRRSRRQHPRHLPHARFADLLDRRGAHQGAQRGLLLQPGSRCARSARRSARHRRHQSHHRLRFADLLSVRHL